MKDSERAPYEKPSVSYWTAGQLDSIEARMSGGGGGGGGGSFARLKWADRWTDSGSEGDYSFEIGLITGLISWIATKDLSNSCQIGGIVAAAVADWFVSNSIPRIYYTRKVQHLYIYSGTPLGGSELWDLAGSAVRTEYYGDPAHSQYAGELEFSDVASKFSYMNSSLRWW